MKKSLFCCCILMLGLTSCHSEHKADPNFINPELIGKWNDDQGCSLEFGLIKQQLYLINFSDSHQHHWQQIPLQLSKQSIMTKFTSKSSAVQFSGTFSEGFVMIDQNYCQQALHKDSRS